MPQKTESRWRKRWRAWPAYTLPASPETTSCGQADLRADRTAMRPRPLPQRRANRPSRSALRGAPACRRVPAPRRSNRPKSLPSHRVSTPRPEQSLRASASATTEGGRDGQGCRCGFLSCAMAWMNVNFRRFCFNVRAWVETKRALLRGVNRLGANLCHFNAGIFMNCKSAKQSYAIAFILEIHVVRVPQCLHDYAVLPATLRAIKNAGLALCNDEIG